MLSVPLLAGSAAFAVSETRNWPRGLEYDPRRAKRFYSIIVMASVGGVALDWLNINPIKALFWSAVLNGIAAVPLMAAMMIIASRRKVMGQFTAEPALLVFGWGATGVMAAATLSFFATLL